MRILDYKQVSPSKVTSYIIFSAASLQKEYGYFTVSDVVEGVKNSYFIRVPSSVVLTVVLRYGAIVSCREPVLQYRLPAKNRLVDVWDELEQSAAGGVC